MWMHRPSIDHLTDNVHTWHGWTAMMEQSTKCGSLRLALCFYCGADISVDHNTFSLYGKHSPLVSILKTYRKVWSTAIKRLTHNKRTFLCRSYILHSGVARFDVVVRPIFGRSMRIRGGCGVSPLLSLPLAILYLNYYV